MAAAAEVDSHGFPA